MKNKLIKFLVTAEILALIGVSALAGNRVLEKKGNSIQGLFGLDKKENKESEGETGLTENQVNSDSGEEVDINEADINEAGLNGEYAGPFDSEEETDQAEIKDGLTEGEALANKEEKSEETYEYIEERVRFSDTVEKKLSEMTLEEKAAQIFLLTPEKFSGADPVDSAGAKTQELLKQYPIAGFMYSEKNIVYEGQVKTLLVAANQYSTERIGLPLILAIEEESGTDHSPIAKKLKYDAGISASAIGESGDINKVEEMAKLRSGHLKNLGFNLLAGPIINVADGVDAEYDKRCYSSDPVMTVDYTMEELSCMDVDDLSTAVKYFPAVHDVDKSLDDMMMEELLPFQNAIDQDAGIVIVANVHCAAITENEEDICTLTENTVDQLRARMGYEGLLMTASLSEQAVTEANSSADAAVKAFTAGMDLLYDPENFVEAYEAIVNGVNAGTISMDRLDNAVGRILVLKENF